MLPSLFISEMKAIWVPSGDHSKSFTPTKQIEQVNGGGGGRELTIVVRGAAPVPSGFMTQRLSEFREFPSLPSNEPLERKAILEPSGDHIWTLLDTEEVPSMRSGSSTKALRKVVSGLAPEPSAFMIQRLSPAMPFSVPSRGRIHIMAI